MFFTIQTLLATLGLHWLIRTTTRPVRQFNQLCSQRRETRLRKRIHRWEHQNTELRFDPVMPLGIPGEPDYGRNVQLKAVLRW